MIIGQVEKTVAGIVLAIAVIIVGFVAWGVTSGHYKNKISNLEKNHADQVAQYERNIGAIKAKAQEETAAAMQRMKDAQAALVELDKKKSKELANAKAENDALMRDVADGTRRVRILQANLTGCNSGAGTSSRDTSTGSMGDGTTVELSAAAGQLIYNIREGIITDQAKLTYLQNYVSDVVKQCKRL